jgi:hypothetical protein
MEVKAHNTALSGEVIFRPSWIFNSVVTDESLALFEEIIRSISYSEQILISRVPTDSSDILSPSLVGSKTPQRKYTAIVVTLWILSCVFIIFIVKEFNFVSILDNHSFHDLKASLH